MTLRRTGFRKRDPLSRIARELSRARLYTCQRPPHSSRACDGQTNGGARRATGSTKPVLRKKSSMPLQRAKGGRAEVVAGGPMRPDAGSHANFAHISKSHCDG